MRTLDSKLLRLVAGLILCSFSRFSLSQTTDQPADFYPTATEWLLHSAAESSHTAIKSVFLILCTKTSNRGTGFLLKDGPIITNEHVIRDCGLSQIMAWSPTGERITFSDLRTDSVRDLAALVPDKPIPDGFLLSTDTIPPVGTSVWTWGYPLAYSSPPPLLSVGYISGFRLVRSPKDSSRLVGHLVVNGAFNAGNSGGPLVWPNSNKVIAVVSQKAVPFFSRFIRTILDAFKKESEYGFFWEWTDEEGKTRKMTEAQIMATVADNLRQMTQVMIGEAISLSELRQFLNESGIRAGE